MFYAPPKNGVTIQRSVVFVKNPVRDDRQSALVHGPTDGCTQESRHSRQVLCRELTFIAVKGSERPSSPNRPGSRVDFIPKGISMQDQGNLTVRWLRVRLPMNLGLASKYLSVWLFGVVRTVGRHSEVTERYPPYSRLALAQTHLKRWVGSGKRTMENSL